MKSTHHYRTFKTSGIPCCLTGFERMNGTTPEVLVRTLSKVGKVYTSEPMTSIWIAKGCLTETKTNHEPKNTNRKSRRTRKIDRR